MSSSYRESTPALCRLLLWMFLTAGFFASPAFAQWSEDSLRLARYQHAAVESGGELYFAGGYPEDDPSTASVEIYDPSTGTWRDLSMSVSRAELALASTQGFIAFAGGREKVWEDETDLVELYDTTTDSWSIEHLPHAAYCFSGVGLDGKFYFHGGNKASGPDLEVAQIYDLATDTWTVVDLQAGPRACGSACTDGRRVFFVSGGSEFGVGSETVNIYDSLTDQWSMTTMPRRRGGPRVAVLNGKLYVSGGFPLRVVDIYDIAAGTWETVQMPGSGRLNHACFVVDPYVIFAAGNDLSFDYLPSADIWNSLTEEWVTTPISLHGWSSANYGAGSSEHRTGVVAGGSTGAEDDVTDAVDVFRYQPSLGTNFCGPANLNSTGKPATLSAFGIDVAAASFLTLWAENVPPGQLGYFLASETQGFASPGGSQGNLCLGGDVARIRDEVRVAGPDGTFGRTPNLQAVPTHPPSAVLAGETWHFQAWFRDQNPHPTSNFTDGLSVTFE